MGWVEGEHTRPQLEINFEGPVEGSASVPVFNKLQKATPAWAAAPHTRTSSQRTRTTLRRGLLAAQICRIGDATAPPSPLPESGGRALSPIPIGEYAPWSSSS